MLPEEAEKHSESFGPQPQPEFFFFFLWHTPLLRSPFWIETQSAIHQNSIKTCLRFKEALTLRARVMKKTTFNRSSRIMEWTETQSLCSQRLEKALKAEETDNIRTISGNSNYEPIMSRNSSLDFCFVCHIICLYCYVKDFDSCVETNIIRTLWKLSGHLPQSVYYLCNKNLHIIFCEVLH